MVFQQLLHKQPFLILMTEKKTACVFTHAIRAFLQQQQADKSRLRATACKTNKTLFCHLNLSSDLCVSGW